MHTIDEIELRIQRFDAEIHDFATTSPKQPLVDALQTLRGVKEVTAVTLVAEIGDFTRFAKARDLMGYTGLVPSEYSSGLTRRQGNITKAGNTHVRRVLVEAAWSYRYQPALKGDIKKRQEGQSSSIQQISWKAQNRLHRKYVRLVSKGKPKNKVVTGVARELAGFIWAIATQLEKCA